MVQQIQQQLLEVLQKIDRPGTFCTSGRLPPTLPGLEVAGLGPVALPLEKHRAATLKKLARQAPYGKGAQTLVDTNVRRVWEIDADQVVLANPEWSDVLKKAVSTVQNELGLDKQMLEAHLYKLLLYDPGSFFLAHRDGEKLDRMVATLVIVLPTAHEGGELVVRHEGREVTVNFGPESRFKTQFAAFYADCEHEIRPVKSGHRLALVYNLALAKSKRTIMAPTSHEHIAAVVSLLRKWTSETPIASDSSDESAPSKLAVLLDHQYTQAGLTCETLKGIDRAKADILFAGARESGCDASLALVTYWANGSVEASGAYGYGYRGSRRRSYDRYHEDDDEDQDKAEYIMGEVFDSRLTAEHFSDVDGNPLVFGQIPLDEDEIVSEHPFDEGEPDQEDFEGYTGNAGMTLERWYHRAAILLWPADARFTVLCESGVRAAVGGLEQMVRQWKRARKSDQETLKQACLEFAERIISVWQEQNSADGQSYSNFDSNFAADKEELDDIDDEDYEDDVDEEDDGHDDDAEVDVDQKDSPAREATRATLIALLDELGDISLISSWLRGVLAKDPSVDPGETLGDVCERHGWSTFENELRELFEKTSNETLERHARLLANWSVRKDGDSERERLCNELAQHIMSALESWDPKQATRNWRARKVNRKDLLPPLAQSFLALGKSDLFERLVTYVLNRPKEFDLTTIQVPALLSLNDWLRRNITRMVPSLNSWLGATFDQLEFRRSHPPQEPCDWRREAFTGCDCADCKELSRFLKNPKMETLRLPLAEHRRQHLHQVIDGQRLDTTHVTERRGRPYTLICTKTKGSYERAVTAHQVDLDQLAEIRKLMDWHKSLPNKGKSTSLAKRAGAKMHR